ncbi:Hypothetical protein (Fragment) [Durusdinium trenchii]|uniref:Feruloyl esterase n=1 Tax=Durusdinium trenchii TaxID=1381693 RepID=A0ABP0M0B7_9DINO
MRIAWAILCLGLHFPCEAVSRDELEFRRWQHEGAERLYLLFAPHLEEYEANRSLPLWLLCPGTNVDALSMLSIVEVTRLAEKHVVAVAVLEGVGLALNVGLHSAALPGRPDDVSYTRAVIADAASRVNIDEEQIYCLGSSRGARFCSRLASELPASNSTLAGLLVNAGLRFPRPNNGTALPIVTMHDLQDGVNPYDGQGAAYWQESVEDAVEAWADFNGCGQRLPPRSVLDLEESLGPTWLHRHSECESFTDVWLLVTNTGRHAWPGELFTELGWRFLQQQRLLKAGQGMREGELHPDEWPLVDAGAARRSSGSCASSLAWLSWMSWLAGKIAG